MVMFFNKNVDFESLSSGKPLKGSDNRYFIPFSLSQEDEPVKDIMCQFSKQVATVTNLDVPSIEFNVSCEESIDFIKECDEQMLSVCKLNKEKWFGGKDITDAYVEQAFMPSIKEVKKQKRVYTFKTRACKELTVFDNNKKEFDKSSVEPSSKVAMIVQLTGLWFTGTRFGITWKTRQVKLNDAVKTNKLGESLFVDEDSEEEVDIDNVFPDE